jgi:hypothetical protein
LLFYPILRAALKAFIIVVIFALSLVASIRDGFSAFITGTVASVTCDKRTRVGIVSLLGTQLEDFTILWTLRHLRLRLREIIRLILDVCLIFIRRLALTIIFAMLWLYLGRRVMPWRS